MNKPPVENDARHETATPAEDNTAAGTAQDRQQALTGPFSLRDVVVFGSVLVMLVGSVLPFALGPGVNLWNTFTVFYLGIGILLPLVVAGLFAGRRFAPGATYRIGSLSLDQFASVVAVLATAFFFVQLTTVYSIGSLLGLIGSLGLLAATTFGPHLPFFAADFAGRQEIPAHVVAREAQPLRRRPAAPKPPKAEKPAPAAEAVPAIDGIDPAATISASAGTDDAPASEAPAKARRFQLGRSRSATADDQDANQDDYDQDDAASSMAASELTSGRPAETVSTAAVTSTDRPAAADEAGGATAIQVSDVPASSRGGDAEEAADAGAAQSKAPEPLAATTVNPTVSQAAAPAAGRSGTGPDTRGQEAPESISATREDSENVVEAFWFAVGTPRQIVDERTGLPLFMFHPGDWELGLEDRGHEFLVQDKRTGRIGVLRDLSNIERVTGDGSSDQQ